MPATKKPCHGSALIERPSNKDGVKLFTCSICGQKWAWTENAGYYQQGRPKSENPKSVVVTKRVTERESMEIREGRAHLFVYRHRKRRRRNE